jgi:Mn2+/Fe2+ NRAMP family transporter
MGIFGVSKFVAVPLGAALVWYVIVKGSYKPVERILILFSLIYIAYPVSAFFAHPDWHSALVKTMVPEFRRDPAYITMMVGLIGTTITPWMQFYLQASLVEKGVTKKDYRLARWDVVLGCIVTDVIAFFIVVACAATLFKSGHGEIKRCSGSRSRPETLCGGVCVALVWRRSCECLVTFGGHPATGDGLQRV